jgi:hypothetical protein
MKRLLFTTLFIILIASGYYFRDIFFGLGSFVFDKAPQAKSAPARPQPGQPVLADVAVEMAAPIQVAAIGTVQPIATVMIKSRVDGEIAQVHFKEGQEVKEGTSSSLSTTGRLRRSWNKVRPPLNAIEPRCNGLNWRSGVRANWRPEASRRYRSSKILRPAWRFSKQRYAPARRRSKTPALI